MGWKAGGSPRLAVAGDVASEEAASQGSRLGRGAEPENWKNRLFVEDVLLPEQYFGGLRRQVHASGEEQLFLAILEDAVHCFRTNLFATTPRRQRMYEEAEQWLLGESDASVSFEYVCQLFDLDMDWLRAGLERWRDRELAKAADEGRAASVGDRLERRDPHNSRNSRNSNEGFQQAVGA